MFILRNLTDFTILALLISTVLSQTLSETCNCINGGKCIQKYWKSSCVCPEAYLGQNCEVLASSISNQLIQVPITSNVTYFTFLANQTKHYRFSFDICMVQNPFDLELLVYIAVEDQQSTLPRDSSVFTNAKIMVQQGKCLTFNTQYIEVKIGEDQPYKRIIFGIKSLTKSIKNYFYRSVTGKNLRNISNNVQLSKHNQSTHYDQYFYFSANYQVYQGSISQIIIKGIIKLMVFLVVFLIIVIFAKILLFSYNISTKETMMYIYRWTRLTKNWISLNRQGTRYSQIARTFSEQNIPSDSTDLNSQQESCPICHNLFQADEQVRKTSCGHLYHEECLEQWSYREVTCPMCRVNLLPEDLSWLRKLFI